MPPISLSERNLQTFTEQVRSLFALAKPCQIYTLIIVNGLPGRPDVDTSQPAVYPYALHWSSFRKNAFGNYRTDATELSGTALHEAL